MASPAPESAAPSEAELEADKTFVLPNERVDRFAVRASFVPVSELNAQAWFNAGSGRIPGTRSPSTVSLSLSPRPSPVAVADSVCDSVLSTPRSPPLSGRPEPSKQPLVAPALPADDGSP